MRGDSGAQWEGHDGIRRAAPYHKQACLARLIEECGEGRVHLDTVVGKCPPSPQPSPPGEGARLQSLWKSYLSPRPLRYEREGSRGTSRFNANVACQCHRGRRSEVARNIPAVCLRRPWRKRIRKTFLSGGLSDSRDIPCLPSLPNEPALRNPARILRNETHKSAWSEDRVGLAEAQDRATDFSRRALRPGMRLPLKEKDRTPQVRS